MSRTRMMRNLWLAVGSLTAVLMFSALGLFPAVAHAQGVGPHVGVGHLAGSAAGLDDGYTSFGGFVPLYQSDAESLWFLDGAFQQYNQGSGFIGGNVSVGHRRYSSLTDSLLGGYVYYDRRELDDFGFDQVGAGIESLGRKWDSRLNVNAPVGDTQNTALAGSLLTTTQALTVVDAETGVKFYDNGTTQLRSFIGVYGLFDNAIDDTAGVRGRIEARMYDQVWVGGFIENDDQFDTTGGFTCELRLGRRGARSSSCCLASRLGDPVQRRKYVAISQETFDFGSNELPPLTNSSGLPGDFDNDGVVDSGDYNVWRENVGQPESGNVLNGNGNGGVVDQSDYNLWVSSFGR